MRGNRKFILGLTYMGVVAVVSLVALIMNRGDLNGVAAVAAAMSSGVGFVIWGNVISNKNSAIAAQPQPPQPSQPQQGETT